MKVSFLDFGTYHGKGEVGSTIIRVKNLIKYWPEAKMLTYGEKMDVMIFQKVYMTDDFRLAKHLDCVKILDICDPDWLDTQMVKETIDNMDAVVVPTKAMQEFIMQLTDKPVRIIKDRFDMDNVPPPKKHKGEIKSVVWFGYKQNAELLRFVVNFLAKKKIKLTVISNEDPMPDRWAEGLDYQFKKYDNATIYYELQKHDACILPEGNRPQDRFKSENKTVKAWLCGLPVIKDSEDFERLNDEKTRQAEADTKRELAISEYDCRQSVKEYQELIKELINGKNQTTS